MKESLKPFNIDISTDETVNSLLIDQIWQHYCKETGVSPRDLDNKHIFLAGAIGIYGVVQAMASTENPEAICKVLDDLYDEACDYNRKGEFRFDVDPMYLDSNHRLN